MRSIIFTVIFQVLLGSFAGPAFCGQVSDNAAVKKEQKAVIVARVNGAAITLDRVNETTGGLKMKESKGKERDDSSIRKEALDRLIFQELIFQKAKALGLSVDEKKTNDAVDRIRTALGEAEYRKYLDEQGLSEEDLKKRVEKTYLGEMVVAREVADKIVTTEDELRKTYEKEKPSSFTQEEKISVIDVVFFLDTGDPRSLTKAEDVRRKIDEDSDRNPLKLSSDGTFAVVEIDRLRKDNEEQLYEEAKKLKPGDLSGIIKTNDSIHIIKLVGYTPEKVTPFEEVKGYLQKKIKAGEIKKRLREWESGLRKEATIEIDEKLLGAGDGKSK